MKTRVLMVGPASLGGISSLIRTIMPVLDGKVVLQFFPTIQKRQPNKAGQLSIGNLALAIGQYFRFLAALAQFHPEIVHLHTSQGSGWLKDTFFVLVSKFFGIRLVLHLHASDFDKFYAKTPKLMRGYTRWVLNRADAVICVSESWKNLVAQVVQHGRVYRYINCINVSELSDHNHKATDGNVRALFLGAVGVRKGIPELLDAMSILQSRDVPLHLWIAGSEEKQGDLAYAEAKINQQHLGSKCELIGDVREERKAKLLESADIFVLPSHHEGLPIALLESMASGMAVVSTPVGGIPEIISDGYNGFLVEPGNVTDLADRLAMLVSDSQQRQNMGRINRQIAETDLNVENYVSRLVELYQAIC